MNWTSPVPDQMFTTLRFAAWERSSGIAFVGVDESTTGINYKSATGDGGNAHERQ